jgi:hypothetical protein
MCATFLPLLYSVLLPNEDIERVVGALREGGTAPSDAETVVEQAKAAAGSLTTAIQVGYYTGVTATFHLSGSHSPEQTKVSQTTYIAWFQKHSSPCWSQLRSTQMMKGKRPMALVKLIPLS